MAGQRGASGGGGGGFYGGGGGGANCLDVSGAGGGGSSTGPGGTTFQNGVQSGNGLIVVTYASPTDQLSALQAAATDASPKSGLGKKVSKIENYVASNNILGACAGLADFIKSANAQAGKKGLTKDEAAALVSQAEAIESTLGC